MKFKYFVTLVLFFISVSSFCQTQTAKLSQLAVSTLDDSSIIAMQDYNEETEQYQWRMIYFIDFTKKFLKVDTSQRVIGQQNFGEFIGFGVDSATARVHISSTLQENNTYRGALIESNFDEDFWAALTIKAGVNENQRRYFEYKDNEGNRTNLLGFNAINSFIAFNAETENPYHYISADAQSHTKINAGKGVNAVVINRDNFEVGSGGLIVANGQPNNSHPSGSYARINSTEVGSYNGGYIQSWSPDNSKYTRLFANNTKSYIRANQGLEISTSDSEITLSNSSYADKFTFGVNVGDVRFWEYGAGNFSDNEANILLAVQPDGDVVEINLQTLPIYQSTGAAALDNTLSSNSFFFKDNGDGTTQLNFKL